MGVCVCIHAYILREILACVLAEANELTKDQGAHSPS